MLSTETIEEAEAQIIKEAPLFSGLTNEPLLLELVESGQVDIFEVTYFGVILGYATIEEGELVWS